MEQHDTEPAMKPFEEGQIHYIGGRKYVLYMPTKDSEGKRAKNATLKLAEDLARKFGSVQISGPLVYWRSGDEVKSTVMHHLTIYVRGEQPIEPALGRFRKALSDLGMEYANYEKNGTLVIEKIKPLTEE